MHAELDRLRDFGDQLQQQVQRYDQESAMAARLQRDFLPRSMPEVGGLRFAAYYQPAETVSGDVYDVFRLDEDHVGLYVADAVGHGVAAGLLSMFVKRAMVVKRIQGKNYEIVSPAETISLLNDELAQQELPSCNFVSACYAVADARTGEVELARGGHPAPALIRADGNIEFPQPEGALLGVMAGQTYSTVRFHLGMGDRLVIFSDGLGDTFRETDPDRSAHAELAARAHLPIEEILDDLSECLNGLSESCGRWTDDVTIVAMQRGDPTS